MARKAKQPITPEFIVSDDSDIGEGDDDYVASDLSGSEAVSDQEIETPPKRHTRNKATEPPVTPTPKKTPARGMKRTVREVRPNVDHETPSPHQESPKKQRIDTCSSVKRVQLPAKKAQDKASPSKPINTSSSSQGKTTAKERASKKVQAPDVANSGAQQPASTKPSSTKVSAMKISQQPAAKGQNKRTTLVKSVSGSKNTRKMLEPKVAEVINDIGEVDDEEQEDEDAGDDEPEDSAEEAVDADDKEMSEDDSDPSEIEEADEETNDDPKGKNVSAVKLDHKTTYYEDLDPKVELPVLKRCGVFDKSLVDKWLKNSYSDLPMLPGGKRMIGWTNPNRQAALEGFGFFSNIKEMFPDANMKYLRELLCFSAEKSMNVVNLSRVDPSLLCLKVPSHTYTSPYICYRGSLVPARCLMMGMLHEDKMWEAYQLTNGKWMKSISFIPFALEADRMIAVTAGLFGVEQFRGQLLDGNILSLTTCQAMIYEGAPSGSKTRRGRFAKPTSVIGTPSRTSMISVRGPEEDGAFRWPFIILDTKLDNKSVPILDARNKKLQLPENIKNIVETFPCFSGSVPQDSVILACYTASKYEKNGVYASFNILWAAVLCGNDA